MDDEVLDEQLKAVYDEQPVLLDKLPYTREFDKLVASFATRTGGVGTKQEVWQRLVRLRKKGLLGQKTTRKVKKHG